MNEKPDKRGQRGKKLFGFFMVLFVLGLGIGIGTLVSDRVDAVAPPDDSRLQMQTDGKPVASEGVLALSEAFEEVANRLKPVVVNINTEELITRRPSGPEQDPTNPFFEFFGPNPFFGPEQQMRRSLGSGVIVDPKGYIITNNHVVEGATKIKVSLQGGKEYSARVIGADPISDIAVIKIDGDKEFPFASIGNSRATKVGDWVIAVGSPFSLDQTVTAGIISAIGRTFSQDAGPSRGSFLNDYLQTDAAINPGNSGGPLVNMNAEVVGINSFISTSSGASAGVGFAVPAHHFVRVYNQILEKGKVSRGFLGINYNDLPFTPAMAQYFGVKQGSGVLVTRVVGGEGSDEEPGPAAKAGILPEDVIVEFNGGKVDGVEDFLVSVAEILPGTTVKVKVVRKGQEKEFSVALAERPSDTVEDSRSPFNFEDEEEAPKTEIGLEFDNVPGQIARSLNIEGGAYVTSVSPGSLADDAQLIGHDQRGYGDIIIEANGEPITTAQDLLNSVRKLKSGEAVILKFLRVIEQDQRGGLAAGTYYTSLVKP
ncbi:MAG: trypsin-like peptidase domain-containing protein [Acidobacteria bacterium]|nr:trypsin-like peptidase domain-containing protein [Acidobacteriota bacterium]